MCARPKPNSTLRQTLRAYQQENATLKADLIAACAETEDVRKASQELFEQALSFSERAQAASKLLREENAKLRAQIEELKRK